MTPDAFVRAPLPGMSAATAIVHVAPAQGAGFTWYTVEFEAGGSMRTGPAQAFLYVLDGGCICGSARVAANGFAYFPPNANAPVCAEEASRVVVIEVPSLGDAPGAPFFTENLSAINGAAFNGDDGVVVQTLIPPGLELDFAVNMMTFQPGASLPLVEIHVMEHGLFMLEGEGIYRLNDSWYPVIAGDFIYMAPYCPQWFAALGQRPARYLIYKDWNRHPLGAP